MTSWGAIAQSRCGQCLEPGTSGRREAVSHGLDTSQRELNGRPVHGRIDGRQPAYRCSNSQRTVFRRDPLLLDVRRRIGRARRLGLDRRTRIFGQAHDRCFAAGRSLEAASARRRRRGCGPPRGRLIRPGKLIQVVFAPAGRDGFRARSKISVFNRWPSEPALSTINRASANVAQVRVRY